MELLLSEISQALQLMLVEQAYLNEEGDRIVVELAVNPLLGLPRENVLFFPTQGFSVKQVKAAILKIRRELTPSR